MIPLKKSLSSSIGRKYLMGLTGIFLVVFLILHLAGNAFLYFPDSAVFNAYAFKLESLGTLKLVGEIGLIALFGLHIVSAILVTKQNFAARPQKYHTVATKSGPSKANLSSKYMYISGTVLLIFVILHVKHFTLGPGMDAGYVAKLNGEDVRDLHRLVVEAFREPLYVGLYTAVLIFMGFHVRHGFWSAFQSLGAMNPRLSKPIYCASVIIAIVLAIGFIGIPLWIYFDFLGVYK